MRRLVSNNLRSDRDGIKWENMSTGESFLLIPCYCCKRPFKFAGRGKFCSDGCRHDSQRRLVRRLQ